MFGATSIAFELLRLHARTENRDVDVNEKVAPALTAALAVRGTPNPDSYACLKSIKQRVLGVSGSHDVIFYTANAYILNRICRTPNRFFTRIPVAARNTNILTCF